MKKMIGVYSAPASHWVGDGFPVRSMFTYANHGRYLSPFILLDRAGPEEFAPSTGAKRGVGEHPHRGFETVTIVYEGEVAHHDSTGQGGVISAGDVQWMTAASGILHQEYHSEKFTREGGTLDMVQLWVNLPAKDKMAAPGYQLLSKSMIPSVALAGQAGELRVIAGDYLGHQGPANTFTALDVWDLHLTAGSSIKLPTKAGRSVGLVVLHGSMNVANEEIVTKEEIAILDDGEGSVFLRALEDAVVLFLSGDPIHEPVVGYGPFVMNSEAEIIDAIDDFNQGRFGKIA